MRAVHLPGAPAFRLTTAEDHPFVSCVASDDVDGEPGRRWIRTV